MASGLNKWLYLAAGAAIPFGLLFAVFCLWWLKDVHDDRTHEVVINAPTAVFAGAGENGGCSGRKLMVVTEGSVLQVRRIHYLKGCATVDVVLPSGEPGYFILGVGDISVEPPLAPAD